ncbi:hypothetical protein Q4485_09945 [Granulosicoccaceae sp. 1_MG-2023]|nr:hypothetical protein [Granulosicoccaceae sp. 1_MG-2023]
MFYQVLSMEIRQVLILAGFVVSAVFAKSLMGAAGAAAAVSKSSPADFMFAALPADLVDAGTRIVPGLFSESMALEPAVNAVPGSFVAMIVALLGLVAVARRQA